jgi:CheY-like chemotaxis protein
MANRKKILIVDDDPIVRKTSSFLIHELGYEPSTPASPGELKKALAFESFDSALVDLDLHKWREELEDYKLENSIVKNGEDIAYFCRGIHGASPVIVYSTKGQAPGGRQQGRDLRYISLPKLAGVDMDSFKRNLQPFFRETDTIEKLNPSVPPAAFHEASISRQLGEYKRVCRLNEKWVNFNFEVVGDYSWAILCDKKIETSHYGKALNGNGHTPSEYNIQGHESYPSEEDLASIAARNNAASFILWNTREPRLLEKQFALAGNHLDQIPEHLQDFFGLAMAERCAEVYRTNYTRPLHWCKWLTQAGQIETLKRIYKRLGPATERPAFIANCERMRLPIIVEIYKATVDEVDERSETAWVDLIGWDEFRPTTKSDPFDLKKLHEHGIKYQNQDFEYTVYRTYTNDEATNIDFVEVPERNPFDSLIEGNSI